MDMVCLMLLNRPLVEMGDMDGGMVYQDEEGNLIMYNHDEMGEEDDDMGGEYGMEGSPGVSDITEKPSNQ